MKVCPESITITDNAIIPLKERVVDEFYDPLRKLLRVPEVIMRFELKALAGRAVPRALAKAERYRLLNEPSEAESICLDALEVDPGNRDVIMTLALALTDQFDDDMTSALGEAWKLIERLNDEIRSGVLRRGSSCERRAKAHFQHGTPVLGSRASADGCAAGDDLAASGPRRSVRPTTTMPFLGGNACARLIMRDGHLSASEERGEPLLLKMNHNPESGGSDLPVAQAFRPAFLRTVGNLEIQ